MKVRTGFAPATPNCTSSLRFPSLREGQRLEPCGNAKAHDRDPSTLGTALPVGKGSRDEAQLGVAEARTHFHPALHQALVSSVSESMTASAPNACANFRRSVVYATTTALAP